jgi:TolA-binding protein
MKRPEIFFKIILLSATIAALFACQPAAEKPADDMFFVPVDTVFRRTQNRESDAVAMVRKDSVVDADKKLKDDLVQILNEHDKYLKELNRELDALDNTGSVNFREESEAVPVEGKVSRESLLASLQKQNLRLKEVIGRIELLAKKGTGYYSAAGEKRNEKNTAAKGTEAQRGIRTDTSVVDSTAEKSNVSYSEAIRLYNRQKYREAVRMFRELLELGIEPDLRDNCYFWTGVCYFNMQKYGRAINELAKVLEIPGSDKKEGTYFMIGQCHEQLGARKSAKAFFTKMLEEYPEGNLKKVGEIKIALLR